MTQAISSRLERNIPEIMRLWVERADAEVRAAKHLENLALRNSLPEYLTHLASMLSLRIDRTEARRIYDKKESTRVGKKHGKERAKAMNYTMDQLILEYHILRQVICDVMETEAPLDSNEREVIVCSIEQAVNDAATEYSDTLRELQEQFSHTLAHDLRTPLTSAKLGAEMIVKNSGDPVMHVASARNIIRSVNRVDRMISDLLDASRLRAGEGLPLEFKSCDLNELVQAVSVEMNLINKDRFSVTSDGACVGLWDRDALRRVVENISTNAVKYGTEGTPVSITLTQTATEATVNIHNEGKPIPHDEQETLFQPYRRSVTSEKKVGWGLGLTIVKGMIEAHKGTIQVVSEEGKGTSFAFTVPKDPEQSETM